ncbi:hypothetical protein Tco_1462103, partial [Tanacetum coccineum]
MLVSTSIIFPSANSTEYPVSIINGTMSLKGLIIAEVRLLSTRLLDDIEVTAVKVRVTAVKHNLVLLINFDERYAK